MKELLILALAGLVLYKWNEAQQIAAVITPTVSANLPLVDANVGAPPPPVTTAPVAPAPVLQGPQPQPERPVYGGGSGGGIAVVGELPSSVFPRQPVYVQGADGRYSLQWLDYIAGGRAHEMLRP